jgi:hypothetical protein
MVKSRQRESEVNMSAVKATWKNGQVVLEGDAHWPEGRRLLVVEESVADDDEQPDDPETIARWIAEFEAIPPLEMTAEEEAEWQAARKAQRDLEKSTFNERVEELRRMFE